MGLLGGTRSRRSVRRNGPQENSKCHQNCVHQKVRYIIRYLSTGAHCQYRYNSKDHPVAFHKASVFGKAKIAAGPAPDVEDAYDIDDEVPADVDDDADEDNEDVSKDKVRVSESLLYKANFLVAQLIKQPKAKKATAKATAKAPAKPKAKPKAKA